MVLIIHFNVIIRIPLKTFFSYHHFMVVDFLQLNQELLVELRETQERGHMVERLDSKERGGKHGQCVLICTCSRV